MVKEAELVLLQVSDSLAPAVSPWCIAGASFFARLKVITINLQFPISGQG